MFTLIDQPDTETKTVEEQALGKRLHTLPTSTHTTPARLPWASLIWWVLLGIALILSLLDQFLFFREIVTCGLILAAAQIAGVRKKINGNAAQQSTIHTN